MAKVILSKQVENKLKSLPEKASSFLLKELANMTAKEFLIDSRNNLVEVMGISIYPVGDYSIFFVREKDRNNQPVIAVINIASERDIRSTRLSLPWEFFTALLNLTRKVLSFLNRIFARI